MAEDVLHLDFETRSEVDLKKCGSDVYANHPSTEVIIATWAINDSPVKLWQHPDGNFPSELSEAILDPEVQIRAFNAPFEEGVINSVLQTPVPTTRFHDVMVHAYALGFSGGLDSVGQQIGIAEDQQKLSSGKRLITKFCKPRRLSAANQDKYWDWVNAPDQWQQFCDYGLQDTVAEMAIDAFCEGTLPMPEDERALWLLDRQINARGLPIDMNLVGGALVVEAHEKTRLKHQLIAITTLDNPNSGPQMLGWIKEKGILLPNLQKATVAEFLKNSNDGQSPEIRDIRAALKLRQSASKTSTAKWGKIKASVGSGDRLRNTLQMNGAGRTGRWAGRGAQYQNVPQGNIKAICPNFSGSDDEALKLTMGAANTIAMGDPELTKILYSDTMGVLSGAIRQAVTARPNHTLMASDLSSIESVVLAWVADCQFKLDIFIQGRDAYKVFAAQYYQIAESEVTSAQRKFSKPAELGSGFGLGAQGLLAYAEGFGVKLTKEESQNMVNIYRSMYVEIVEAWAWLIAAVERVTQTGVSELGYKVEIGRNARFLHIKLPSGRYLFYDRPEMAEVETPWGQKKQGFTYMGTNQYTRKYERLSTHGGKLIENCLAGETQILTSKGWIWLMEYVEGDELWDGHNWVRGGELLYRGVQSTISIMGVWMTPDHKVLTPEGWLSARVIQDTPPAGFWDTQLPAGVDDPRHELARRTISPRMFSVFDIANVGPRQRFTVRGDGGEVFIVHNCVQAISRDILKLGIFESTMEGFDPVLLVHDEIVTEVPLSDPYLTVDLLNDCLTRGADWTKGLPLKAAGWSGKRYRKD